MSLSRRLFLALTPVAPLFIADTSHGQTAPVSSPPDSFPAHEPGTVLEVVTVAHGNLARVRELLSNRPALTNAAWDWGYGDWETPLGAASHIGNREIATLLLSAGARPTIFSAAMLGQLDVVKAFITSAPGIQRTRGPHGIPLLAHARAGHATEVVSYLESVGDANVAYRNEPLDEADRAACLGEYRFGSGSRDQLVVSATERGALMIRRNGAADRNLLHLGGLVFHPAGADAVRIRFAAGRPAPSVTIEDGPVVMTAWRTQ
jgi:hypothetical protein